MKKKIESEKSGYFNSGQHRYEVGTEEPKQYFNFVRYFSFLFLCDLPLENIRIGFGSLFIHSVS